jgi:soluble lytic murein transglycosylase-like protein
MEFCLRLSGFSRFSALVLFSAAAAIASSDSLRDGVSHSPRIKSIVRADTRTGRLVRTIVVNSVRNQPKPVQPPLAEPGSGSVPELALTIPDLVEKTARKYDVDPLLVHSVIQVESNYNPYALSPKGARGLMQLMPGTARRFGVRNTFDVKDNIEGGVKYLRFLTDLFPYDTRLAVAAYNAGEGAVSKYKNNIPPYRETEQYVHKVGQRYSQAKRAADHKQAIPGRPAEISPAAAAAAAESEYAHVEYSVDSDGRLRLQTATPKQEGAHTP